MRFIDADELLKSIIQMSTDGNVFDKIRNAPTIDPRPEWIPVSERLPEYGQVVLWCNEHGSVFTSAITARCGDSWAIGKRHRRSKVIAWMPLPEPYKGEEE